MLLLDQTLTNIDETVARVPLVKVPGGFRSKFQAVSESPLSKSNDNYTHYSSLCLHNS